MHCARSLHSQVTDNSSNLRALKYGGENIGNYDRKKVCVNSSSTTAEPSFGGVTIKSVSIICIIVYITCLWRKTKKQLKPKFTNECLFERMFVVKRNRSSNRCSGLSFTTFASLFVMRTDRRI